MHENSFCLNCGQPTVGKFCSNCGQKTDTHRITFKHLIFHDIIHGVWHIEKGIIFTLKQALIRPGRAAIEYISGQRIKYYNVFYLILIVVGFSIFIEDKIAELDITYGVVPYIAADEYDTFMKIYAKICILSLVPLIAFFGFVIFRKSKYNFSEHCIISATIFLGIMLVYIASLLLMFCNYVEYFEWIALCSDSSILYLLLFFIMASYYQAVGKMYSKLGFLWRILTFVASIVVVLIFAIDQI